MSCTRPQAQRFPQGSLRTDFRKSSDTAIPSLGPAGRQANSDSGLNYPRAICIYTEIVKGNLSGHEPHFRGTSNTEGNRRTAPSYLLLFFYALPVF
jgi:hypothetical protein